MAVWPFTRGRSTWASGNRITAAIAELWDSQLAQAADGSVWTDAARTCNIIHSGTEADGGRNPGWDSATGMFYQFDVDTGNPVGVKSKSGRTWFSQTLDASDGLTPLDRTFASDGAGVMLIGGTPGSSSNKKFRRSTGGTWAAVNSSQTTTAGVTVISWIPHLSLFIAGHSDGVVETSSSGSSWTNRTVPNSNARRSMATNGSIVVMLASGATTTITSTNGTSWTERAAGITSGTDIAWSAYHSKFFAVGASGTGLPTFYSSTDGITWSTSGLGTFTPVADSADVGTARLVALGRMLICYASTTLNVILAYSIDAGVTWTVADELDDGGGSTPWAAISSGGQMLLTNGSGGGGLYYMTMRGGYF